MKTEEFARRRRQLMKMAGDGTILILNSAPVRLRNRDTPYPYRQDSDFFYLTGFPEPEAVLVMLPGREQGEQILFCREREPEAERWDGARAGLEGARETYGMDDAFPITDIDEILPGLIEGRNRVYYTIGRDKEFDQRIMNWAASVGKNKRPGARAPGEFVSLTHYLHDLRLFKNRPEVSALSKAARLAAKAHRRAMAHCRPGMYEFELAAEILHEFLAANAVASYEPIVGGGANACVLHYITNQDRLKDGDLVLIDAGAELNCYASDVTRTFPVNGKFSPRQKDLYEVVLEAQEAAIDAVAPGRSWRDPHDAAVGRITRGLVDLGLLTGDPDALIEDEAFKRFYPHKTGHWIGLDVHDVGEYQIDGHSRELETGMVFTIEPGVYLPPDDEELDEAWRGIGIRIEDDVAVTRDGCRVLSKDAPKTVAAIEECMRQ
ncbi:MAG: aminopeptidase P N-terminal domain-containing protein [Xanthomonadales bacterium]|nr:aminopeptidase P N-terminal domain-containing protein [Xanthomonadales bacterium]